MTDKDKIRARWMSFKSGFSMMSIIATLYAIVLFIPANIYIILMTGSITIAASWFSLLFFVEISKLSGKPLAKQEATMILLMSNVMLYAPLLFIYNAWYRASPIAKLFDIGQYIPDWAAPPPDSGVLQLRTFFHPSWVMPILVYMSAWTLSWLGSWGFGFLAREIFIETEKLPFPLQKIDATAIITLTSNDRRALGKIGFAGLIGFIWGFFLYTMPFIYQAYTGTYKQFIPLPWIDWNLEVQKFFPGASLGLATDIGHIASAFVLGTPTVLGIFLASMATFFFGNWLTVIYNLSPTAWWVPGMNVAMSWQRSLLYFWAPILVGTGLAVGLAPLIRHPNLLRRALSSMTKIKIAGHERITDPVSFKKVVLPMCVIPMVLLVIIFVVLVPSFVQVNSWIIVFILGLPIIYSLIQGRALGETGMTTINPNTVRSMLFYVSGYSNVDVWFTPHVIFATGAGFSLTSLKVGELTDTKSSSIFKMFWLLLPIGVLAGFLYLELLWRISPIPSGRYPGVKIYWEVDATITSLWIKGRQLGLFNPTVILYSFILSSGLYMLLNLLHSPVSFIALGVGASTITPIAFSMFIGVIIAKIIKIIYGKEWWDANKMLLSAGLLIGESIAVTLSIAIALIITSLWTLPY